MNIPTSETQVQPSNLFDYQHEIVIIQMATHRRVVIVDNHNLFGIRDQSLVQKIFQYLLVMGPEKNAVLGSDMIGVTLLKIR